MAVVTALYSANHRAMMHTVSEATHQLGVFQATVQEKTAQLTRLDTFLLTNWAAQRDLLNQLQHLDIRLTELSDRLPALSPPRGAIVPHE